MKKMLLFVLMAPLIVSAQKFEVSEMGGYSRNVAGSFFTGNSGYANRLSVDCRFVKHFSIGVFDQLNNWKTGTNAAGISADAHFGHFEMGMDISELFINAPVFQRDGEIIERMYVPNGNYSTVPEIVHNKVACIGLHVGLDQKLAGRFFAKEQVGYSSATVKEVNGALIYPVSVHDLYCLAGIACRF